MQFDWLWFFIGLGIVAVGVLILRYYNKLADVTRVMNYTKWQMAGIIVIIVGFLMAINVHTLIVTSVTNLIISGGI